MKFTRTVTITQVRRKIVLAAARQRCPRCGFELELEAGEREGREKAKAGSTPSEQKWTKK